MQSEPLYPDGGNVSLPSPSGNQHDLSQRIDTLYDSTITLTDGKGLQVNTSFAY